MFSRRGGYHTIHAAYRSGLENNIAEQLKDAGVSAVYEKFTLPYTIPATQHKYTPDFILPNGIIVEAKGIFDVADRQKHILVKKQYPNLEVRFVFSNPKTKLYKGSKTTYGAWCEKHGYKYAKGYIPDSWLADKHKYSLEGLIEKKGVKDKDT